MVYSSGASNQPDSGPVRGPAGARRLRVLFLSHSSAMAGAERSLLTIVRNLDRERFEPVVLLPEDGPLLEAVASEGISVRTGTYRWFVDSPELSYRQPWRGVRKDVSTLLPTVASLRPDLIYTNTLVIPQGALLARKLRVPHVWHVREILTSHARLRYRLAAWLYYLSIAATSTRVFAVSEAVRRMFPLPARYRVKTVYNGLEPSAGARSSARPTNAAGPRMVVVGAITEHKGQLEALQSLAIVRRQLRDAHLTFIGESTAAYMSRVEAFVAEENLGPSVEFRGYVPDARTCLREYDLSLVPSWNESFSRVALESLAEGVPVVASKVGGIPEVLAAGGGVLVPPRDPDAMANAIIELWKAPERRQRLSEEGQASARRFTVERMMWAIEAELLRVASR